MAAMDGRSDLLRIFRDWRQETRSSKKSSGLETEQSPGYRFGQSDTSDRPDESRLVVKRSFLICYPARNRKRERVMDRGLKFVLAVMAISLSVIAVENVGVFPAVAQSTSQTRTVANQWEYFSFAVQSLAGQAPYQLRDNLAKAGRDGWELVSVTEFSGALFFYFKRPLK